MFCGFNLLVELPFGFPCTVYRELYVGLVLMESWDVRFYVNYNQLYVLPDVFICTALNL